jgi:hypothetical protein
MNNEGELGVPFYFVAVGLVLWDGWPLIREKTSGFLKFFVPVTALLLVFDAGYFQLRVNHWKQVQGLHRVLRTEGVWPSTKGTLPSTLSFMRWVTPESMRPNPGDYERLFDYLGHRRENIFLVADQTLLYGALKKPSMNLAPWIDVGLSVPWKDSPAFPAYVSRVEKQVFSNHACLFVIGQNRTQPNDHLWLGNFPELQQAAKDARASTQDLGYFTVIDACAVPGFSS